MGNKQRMIFIVDDDATNLALGRDTLGDYYDILTLNSGARLLRVLEKTIPDLILLDVEMPEMNGYEVMRHIKSKPETSNVPVIFLTAKRDGASELEGLSLGAIDYISKPFSPPLLHKRIEIHLLVESQKQELVDFNNNLQSMVEAQTKTVIELQNAVLSTMADLVERRDDITGGHIERTQAYLKVMLAALKDASIYKEEIDSWDVNLVLQSAQLHDVGKIAIKDSILQKTEKLTEEEFEQIKEHPTFGGKIIDKIKESTTQQSFLDYAKVLAESHHEKWDGSGYPKGLKGEDIPLLGRLMAVADVYDALISERQYKKALSHKEAVGIMLDGKGKHFDPVLIDLFLGISDQFDEIATQFD
ncbi:MAG: response regulator [Oscillospiraceae bacterium]|nr:response regulator [Oscillospiraceae bacterium]